VLLRRYLPRYHGHCDNGTCGFAYICIHSTYMHCLRNSTHIYIADALNFFVIVSRDARDVFFGMDGAPYSAVACSGTRGKVSCLN
jgi:hypothetical protein